MKAKTSGKWGEYVPSSQEQFEVKRRAVIIEAGKAFSRNGFHNTSLDDVAKALGVTKPALYRYAKDKNEILFECFNLALDLGDRAMQEALQENTGPLEILRDWLYRYVILIYSDFQSYSILNESKSSLREAEQNQLAKRRREFDSQLRALVSAAIQKGELPGGNPKLMVAFFMGAVNYIPHWFDPNGNLSGDEMAQAFSDMAVAALFGAHTSAASR